MAQHVDALVAARSAPQRGVLTIEQSRACGLTDRMRRQRLADGRLVRAGAHTLRLPAAAPGWEQQVVAAMMEGGDSAVVSHLAAVAWHGFPGISPGAVEITLPIGRRPPRSIIGLAHRSRDLTPTDIQRSGPIVVTTPARSLIDSASRLTNRQLQDCLDWGCREGRLSIPYLNKRIEALRHCGRPGISRVTQVVEQSTVRGNVADSPLERMALAILKGAGLPQPELQQELIVDGRRFYVDLLYRAARLVIELAGYGTHSLRRELQNDAERASLIMALGYRVLTFTYEDVTERPSYVADTTRRHLEL